jgi:O-methyltransferase
MAPASEAMINARRLVAGWRWRLGYLIGTPVPHHFDPKLAATFRRVRRDTLTGPERIAALCDATGYVVRAGIEGAFAECGVWRGGSMMAVALTLLDLGVSDRDLYLYDTFTGMTEPTDEDRSSPYDGYSPQRRWRRQTALGRQWAGVPASVVRKRVESTGYPAQRIHLIEGKVEETLPDAAPERIALLRLDTDWYASTKHELTHLYPRLAERGVLIVDDYGHYEGARRAVDEYLAESDQRLLLNRIDYTGRIAVKQSDG